MGLFRRREAYLSHFSSCRTRPLRLAVGVIRVFSLLSFLPLEVTPLLGEMSAQLTEGCPFSEKKGGKAFRLDE